jgi:hypothetical protein
MTPLTAEKVAELIVGLEKAIEQAEHKPEDWNVSALTFGAAAKRVEYPEGVVVPPFAPPWGEEIIGTFPWKRDGWLAVEAVRALPHLLSLAKRVAGAPRMRVHDTPYGRSHSLDDAAMNAEPGEYALVEIVGGEEG